MRTAVALVQVLLFIVSSFAVSDSNFKVWVDRAAMQIASTTDISFESMDAVDYQVTQAEKALCRDWFDENVLSSENPAYTFKVGGRDFRRNIDDWDFSYSSESEVGAVYRGGKTTYITVSHKKSDLTATVEATIYEDSASCEWTVYIKNCGEENSSVVSDFYAMNATVKTGRKADIYCSKGSFCEADDFEMMKSELLFLPSVFSANGGRTESFLPYFNIHGKDSGVVLAVGWSGQWYTSLSQVFGSTYVKVKQETLEGYLLSGEEVRSPLVSLTFYDSDNVLKGFNDFRSYVVDCVTPEGVKQVTTTGIGIETPGATEDQVLQNVMNIPEENAASLDYAWVDAGWYPIRTSWSDSVGNWYADPARFPNGFGKISEALEERGIELMVWYEIERCCKDTQVYNECIKHDGWLLTGESSDEEGVVNFANEDALEYITDLMLESLRFNGVKCLRMDSNFTPLPYWERADEMWADGREGITENHHVTNLYRFFDTLLEEIPGLKIDMCASGGKRLDIETAKRSIPLWRSDYNCMDGEGNSKPDILQATQAQTFGISFWYPYNGTCAYISGEYAVRTNIISCSQLLDNYDIRKYMVGNYYPLTCGGLDTTKYLAMQFDTDAREGMALIYKREDVSEDRYTLVFNGLYSDRTYVVYDFDKPETKYEMKGSELMSAGIELEINETPKAVIMLYSVK